MFCPVCKAQYREGFTHCSDCHVALVASLETLQGEDPPEMVWRGSDPVAFSRVLDALAEAQITYYVKSTHDHLAFELGMPRPFYEVMVSRSRLEHASPLVASIGDSPAFARSRDPRSSGECEPDRDAEEAPEETP